MTREGHGTASSPSPSARGEQAVGIHHRPQGPPKYPSPGLHRSTTARRHREAWIRRPPHRRDGMESGRGPTYGGLVTLYFFNVERSQRVGGAEYADNRGIHSTPFPHFGGAWPLVYERPARQAEPDGWGLCRHRVGWGRCRVRQPPSDPLRGPPSPVKGEGTVVPAFAPPPSFGWSPSPLPGEETRDRASPTGMTLAGGE